MDRDFDIEEFFFQIIQRTKLFILTTMLSVPFDNHSTTSCLVQLSIEIMPSTIAVVYYQRKLRTAAHCVDPE